jgi:hypothetical protein
VDDSTVSQTIVGLATAAITGNELTVTASVLVSEQTPPFAFVTV